MKRCATTLSFRKGMLLMAFFLGFQFILNAQVKIGDNHTEINGGSLLELESRSKGLLFPRIALHVNLNYWMLDGTPVDGMVVYNTNVNNPAGLYVWYNQRWNHLGGGTEEANKHLHFQQNSRTLYDDGDSTVIPSSRVRNIQNSNDLLQLLSPGSTTEGDIYNLPGTGIYIRNDSVNATTVNGGYIFIPTSTTPGYILYATFSSVNTSGIDPQNFVKGLNKAFYVKPEEGAVFKVSAPPSSGGYYAFAVPNEWPAPRIFLKVANSNGGFFKLNNCWKVARNLQYNGKTYQVWALDVPLNANVMDPDFEFKIE